MIQIADALGVVENSNKGGKLSTHPPPPPGKNPSHQSSLADAEGRGLLHFRDVYAKLYLGLGPVAGRGHCLGEETL
jgi:hypothetical protein